MKKILLAFIILSIIYLSNTPELRVIEPGSWINKPQYETDVNNLIFIKKIESNFYSPYIKEDMMNIDFLLHKMSHIVMYSLLTIVLFMNINIKKFKYFLAWIVVTLFAFTDEIHQYFVIGRSGRLCDVILDSTSSFLTLSMIFLVLRVQKNIRREQLIKEYKSSKKQS